VLSQLEPERQLEELTQSRAILKEQLGIDADALAYPVGRKVSFTGQTQMLVQDAGYRAAFSSYGGTNMHGMTSPYNVKRTKMLGQSWSRFRVRTAVCRSTGIYWP
jgi:hypothetical protein